ncbi:RAMP superfamily CRISPR-associated protein [Streptobacillus canis]|uniref:RAMP superfamily CRISPR-associated protein n=1 Tax=Streptobacillus canis TaxID=2678686 RepID=UPI0012E2C725|nr:RAMP superfamily CRISPR-associated protein [Streptobacillus canis]
MKGIGFNKFVNKYIINGYLFVYNGLHVGMGTDGSEKDSPFFNVNGEYQIPGSSFRGYLRSKIEKILYNFIENEKDDEIRNEKFLFYINDEKKEKKYSKDTIDIIFGTVEGEKIQAGRIFIPDLPMIKSRNKKDDEKNKTQNRDGIMIDKETGLAKDGAKFDYEVVTRGNIFEFKMILENVEEEEIALILLGLSEIMSDEGDLFGGKLSRGIGRCKLVIDNYKYVDEKSIENYILKGEYIEKKKADFDKLVLEKRKNMSIGGN